MSLVLEIEYLLGVAFAARSPASDLPDWPPQPDRVFSALVASWGARGERAEERDALEWLERQSAPQVLAAAGAPRSTATVFVPPNDPETRRVADRAVMPTFRSRQPRRLPACRPDNPILRLVWRETPADSAMLATLNAIAADTSYVGHSTSLVRCRFRTDTVPEAGKTPKRRVYPGRLAELEHSYRSGRRPSPGDSVQAFPADRTAAPASVFSDRWIMLEHVAGGMPDLRAAALVAKALHKCILAGYERAGLGHAIPGAISGHTTERAPAAEPHLGFVPMAFVGPPFADGAVYGFAMVLPRDLDLTTDTQFQSALQAVAPWNDETARRELRLDADGIHLVFAFAGQSPRRSLDPGPYVETAAVWASCTPIVLDRHLKQTGNEARQLEIEALLGRACANIGLPAPERVIAAKHAALRGAPSAYPSGRSPAWAGWRLPPSLASRQLTHAVLQFPEPVQGPVILGAGRFVGLGLCRALDRPGVPA